MLFGFTFRFIFFCWSISLSRCETCQTEVIGEKQFLFASVSEQRRQG